MESKAEWRPMDAMEERACLALQYVTFPVASPTKRAARNLIAQAKGDKQITDKQAQALLWPMIARFRRQIADKELVAYSSKAMGISILRKADTNE